MPDLRGRSEQRALALERANRAKRDAERVRAQIRQAGPSAGARQAAEIIAAGRSRIRSDRLVAAVPYVGHLTARRMLGRARIKGLERVSEISEARRQALVAQLLEHANRSWSGNSA